MRVTQALLKEVISLQALHATGLKMATTLREKLEEGTNPLPKTLARNEVVAKASTSRRIRISRKTVQLNNKV